MHSYKQIKFKVCREQHCAVTYTEFSQGLAPHASAYFFHANKLSRIFSIKFKHGKMRLSTCLHAVAVWHYSPARMVVVVVASPRGFRTGAVDHFCI